MRSRTPRSLSIDSGGGGVFFTCARLLVECVRLIHNESLAFDGRPTEAQLQFGPLFPKHTLGRASRRLRMGAFTTFFRIHETFPQTTNRRLECIRPILDGVEESGVVLRVVSARQQQQQQQQQTKRKKRERKEGLLRPPRDGVMRASARPAVVLPLSHGGGADASERARRARRAAVPPPPECLMN